MSRSASDVVSDRDRVKREEASARLAIHHRVGRLEIGLQLECGVQEAGLIGAAARGATARAR